MPKKLQTINDWSGGFRDAVDARDLKGNESTSLVNIDTSKEGSLVPAKKFQDYSGTMIPLQILFREI